MSVTVLADDRPVARRTHRCEVCGGSIATGDRYRRQRNVSDDGPYVWKVHALCDAAYFKEWADSGCWDEDGPWPGDVLHLVERFFAALTSILSPTQEGPTP